MKYMMVSDISPLMKVIHYLQMSKHPINIKRVLKYL